MGNKLVRHQPHNICDLAKRGFFNVSCFNSFWFGKSVDTQNQNANQSQKQITQNSKEFSHKLVNKVKTPRKSIIIRKSIPEFRD